MRAGQIFGGVTAVILLLCPGPGGWAEPGPAEEVGGTMDRSPASAVQTWAENPWYWSYGNEPVLLLGGSDDDNLFQWPEAKLIAQLDRLAQAGGNVVRNTMSDRKDQGFEVYPFHRQADGKYDLDEWNADYWMRFERLLRETAKRDILVQIEIWDRFDYTDSGGSDRWQIHPYNPKNNVNYSFEQSGFAKRYPDHPGANKQPFFFTTPGQRHNRVVLPYQERFVDRLLERSLPYGNVLYCIDNETRADEAWGMYWADYIRTRAGDANRRVMVTEMWDDWDLTADRHKRTFDHPERYDFVDISQNNHNKGRKHWDNFLYVKNYLSRQPRPMNTTKTYGADGNKFGHTDQDAIERFWRHLLAGGASVRFHRPPAGLGLNDKAVATLRAARKLESIHPLWAVEPAGDHLFDAEDNEAYLVAELSRFYVVYFPAGGSVEIDLSALQGSRVIRWINIDTGEWGPTTSLSGKKRVALKAPGRGNWVAAIHAPPTKGKQL